MVHLGPVGLWTFQLDPLPAAEARAVAAELESLGYGALWLPEAVGRDPFVSAALLLGATDRLRVATGVAQIHARNARAANAAAATLGEAFPGRFLLGLGVSHERIVEGVDRQEYASPMGRMRAYLDRLDEARFFAAAPAEPVQRVLAALGPRMLALARDRAAGAHTYLVPPEHTATAREILGAGRLLAVEQKVVLTADAEEARAVGRRTLALYLPNANYANNLRRLGYGDDDLAGNGSDRLVDAVVVWGDEEAVRARVRQHFDAGADHVCIQVLTADFPAAPLEQWRRLAPVLLA